MKNVGNYMSRAYECLRQAQILMKEEEYTGVCNRAYFAYFDTVRALLATLDIATRSHASVQNLFSLHFVKAGIFDKQDVKALSKLFDMRQNSDYDAEPTVNAEEAQYTIQVTSEFLLQTEAYLRENGFDPSIYS
ncbi:hypothetical protein GCM10027592_09490 [Spirosoma flavus]